MKIVLHSVCFLSILSVKVKLLSCTQHVFIIIMYLQIKVLKYRSYKDVVKVQDLKNLTLV